MNRDWHATHLGAAFRPREIERFTDEPQLFATRFRNDPENLENPGHTGSGLFHEISRSPRLSFNHFLLARE